MERRRLKVIYYTKKKRQLKPPGESRGNPLRNYIEKEENVTRKVNMKTRACFFTKKHTSERQRRTRRSSSWWSQSAKRSLRDFSLFFPEWRLSDVSWRIFMMRWLISSRLLDSVPSLSVPVLSSGVSNGLDSGTNQAIHSLCPLLSLLLSLSSSLSVCRVKERLIRDLSSSSICSRLRHPSILSFFSSFHIHSVNLSDSILSPGSLFQFIFFLSSLVDRRWFQLWMLLSKKVQEQLIP